MDILVHPVVCIFPSRKENENVLHGVFKTCLCEQFKH